MPRQDRAERTVSRGRERQELLGRSERCIHVREHEKVAVESRALQNGADRSLGSRQHQETAVAFQLLHCADQHCEPGAIDVWDGGKVNDEALRLLIDHRAQRRAYLRRDVKVESSFQGEDV